MSSNKIENIAIVGAGKQAKVLTEIIEELGTPNINYYSDKKKEKFKSQETISDKKIKRLFKKGKIDGFVLGLGYEQIETRQKIIQSFEDLPSRTIVASSAEVVESAKIGEGAILMRDCLVNSDAIIGKHTVINTKATVEHDVVLGENCFVNPGAVIAGNVSIGDNSMIGANAFIKENVNIGNNVVIGAGSVVLEDVKDDSKVSGVPADQM